MQGARELAGAAFAAMKTDVLLRAERALAAYGQTAGIDLHVQLVRLDAGHLGLHDQAVFLVTEDVDGGKVIRAGQAQVVGWLAEETVELLLQAHQPSDRIERDE